VVAEAEKVAEKVQARTRGKAKRKAKVKAVQAGEPGKTEVTESEAEQARKADLVGVA